MPVIDVSACDGPECKSRCEDYIEAGWISTIGISWYDGYKDDPEKEGFEIPRYKQSILWDEGRGQLIFCEWECFSKYMHLRTHSDQQGAATGSTDGKAVTEAVQDVGSNPTSSNHVFEGVDNDECDDCGEPSYHDIHEEPHKPQSTRRLS